MSVEEDSFDSEGKAELQKRSAARVTKYFTKIFHLNKECSLV